MLSDSQLNAFLIEAKKIGVIELATHTTSKSVYKISGPVLNLTESEILGGT